jgi:hypothetical protein
MSTTFPGSRTDLSWKLFLSHHGGHALLHYRSRGYSITRKNLFSLTLKVMDGDLVPPGLPRPRVLISNDDGVNAPGLRALVAELHVEEFCDILVCGPVGERSAQSHAITLGKELVCTPITIDGTEPSQVPLLR